MSPDTTSTWVVMVTPREPGPSGAMATRYVIGPCSADEAHEWHMKLAAEGHEAYGVPMFPPGEIPEDWRLL